MEKNPTFQEFLASENPKEKVLSLGIDLGTFALRYVLTDPRTGRIETWGSYEIDAEPSQKGKSPKDFGGLAVFLKDLAKKLPKNRIRNITIKLPAHTALTGTVELPAVQVKERAHVAELAVSRQVEIPLERLAVCATESGMQVEGKTIFNYAAAPKSVVERIVEVVQEAFDPVADVTIQGYALEGLVHKMKLAGEGEAIAFLDIGKSATIISTYLGEHFIFERNIPIGGQDLTRAIMIMYLDSHGPRAARDLAQAEELKKKSFVPHDKFSAMTPLATEGEAGEVLNLEENQKLFRAMEGILTALLHDIRLTLKHFAEKQGGREINRVYLMGSGAELRYFADYLSHRLEVETQFLTCASAPLEIAASTETEDFRRDFHRYAVGLALSLKKPGYATLTPAAYHTAPLERMAASIFRVLAAVCFAIFINWYIYLAAENSNLEYNRKVLWEYKAPLTQIEKPYLEMLRWQKFLASADYPVPTASEILRTLTRIVPTNIVFASATIERPEGVVTMEGSVMGDVNRRAVTMSEFSKAITAVPFFRDPEIRSLISLQDDALGGRFQMTIRLAHREATNA